MGGNASFRLPREVRDLIYTNLLRSCVYVIVNPKAYSRHPSSDFAYCIPDYRPPPYSGLLLASKTISAELQEALYRECGFRAYLCQYADRILPALRPRIFDRIQKVELILDLRLCPQVSRLDGENPGLDWWYPRSQVTGRDLPDPTKYYREFFEAFRGRQVHGVRRKYCHVTIANIVILYLNDSNGKLVHAGFYQDFLRTCKTFVDFEVVVLELKETPPDCHWCQPQELWYRAAVEPAEDAVDAGRPFEALIKKLATTLEPYLGLCAEYDRGKFRCLEYRPSDPLNAQGQVSYLDELGD
ncbi:hypothetical protein IMSHALPRED_003970 [Imshaugia aleurites]|uniref:Uncharacterized protein n=1 Tax=Imshaugia aleurites TaxID=172621 RepID=A0A8H3I9Y5_9LECA|nr:hypothetical protein IMSHALPRED_003970 [Imshaugia aleurites]